MSKGSRKTKGFMTKGLNKNKPASAWVNERLLKQIEVKHWNTTLGSKFALRIR
jgi:hypothetical protein